MMFQHIRDLREDNDLSQREMGEILNISQRTYSYYEKGEHDIPPETLIRIAQFYNTSVDYLLGLTNNKKPYK